MKWGIRRATRQLQKATTREERDKAIATLNKHRSKASNKIDKLNAKRPKLEKAYTKAITKMDPKIAKLERKKFKLQRRAAGVFTSDRKAAKLATKVNAMDMKIQGLKAKSDTAKAAMAKNDRMKSLFTKGISDIDSALASVGKKYING
jgi:predicted RNase H-like nuclease (RuvC/YqgF family)